MEAVRIQIVLMVETPGTRRATMQRTAAIAETRATQRKAACQSTWRGEGGGGAPVVSEADLFAGLSM